jgi:hypothetical protein
MGPLIASASPHILRIFRQSQYATVLPDASTLFRKIRIKPQTPAKLLILRSSATVHGVVFENFARFALAPLASCGIRSAPEPLSSN